MQHLALGRSDVMVSQLVYGVWRLADDSNTSLGHVRSKIDRCLDQGITSFDHADIYGDYRCEALFGTALKAEPSLRQRMQLISKCDIAITSDNFPNRRVKFYDTSPAYIEASLEQSLLNLNTDYLDSLLIHRPDPLMDYAQTGACLDALIDSGKIRSAGVSNFEAEDWRLLQMHMRHPLVTNQVEMSVLQRDAFTNGSLSAMQRDGMRAMAWSPLAGGAIFGDSAAAMRVRPLLEAVASDFSGRIDLAAAAWLLQSPANVAVVMGTNNLDRISGLSDALNVSIDRETWFEIWTAAAGQEVP